MNAEFLHHYSGHLNQEMYLNRYGHAGIPVVVFPSSGGSKDEFADFGMIEAAHYFIEEGKVQFFTLSSHDQESWLHKASPNMTELKPTMPTNVMLLMKLSHSSNTIQVGLTQ